MKNLKSDIGNLYQKLIDYNYQNNEFSFYDGKQNYDLWKKNITDRILDDMCYIQSDFPLASQTLDVFEGDGCIQEEIEFYAAPNVLVKGTVLVPRFGRPPYPAILALHDHGDFYFYGRQKMVAQKDEPEILAKFKKDVYCGRSWANEAAKRGYVVLCIDAFYFGGRKLDVKEVSVEALSYSPFRPDKIEEFTDEYVESYNGFCKYYEQLLIKHIIASGTTWPAILLNDDMRSLDYLTSRIDVDSSRIGCCGMSLGGYRAGMLGALDSRIKCAVVSGWMCSFKSMLFDGLRHHTYMIYSPKQAKYMDYPDVVSLNIPGALFIQQCSKDGLFNMEGMQSSCRKIEERYKAMDLSEKFDYRFYDNKHEFNIRMQNDAFDWLDKWLK